MTIPVQAEILGTAASIFAVVQGLKQMLEKWPWISSVLGSLFGRPEVPAVLGVVLTLAVTAISGFMLYGGDGVLEWGEVAKIVGELFGALGLFRAYKAVAAPVVSIPAGSKTRS